MLVRSLFCAPCTWFGEMVLLERVSEPNLLHWEMSAPLLPDDLWSLVAPLLPPEPPKPKGGRPRVSDRAALTGILFVLKTGCPWQMLPKELRCGSGSTCWRRLRDWQWAGVWGRLHPLLLDRLGSRGRSDWSRAALDSASIPAKRRP